MRNERFIAIEGLDGVGKSTVVEELRKMGYSTLTTPPEIFKKVRPFFEDKDVRVRFLYYLMGVRHAGKQVCGMQAEEKVVSDRYLLTTLSAHEAMGLPPSWLTLCKPLIRSVEKPSNTFLITCDEEERLRRMYDRGANKVDERNLEINDQIISGYMRWSQELGHTLTVVDSTNLLPQDVADVIDLSVLSGNYESTQE